MKENNNDIRIAIAKSIQVRLKLKLSLNMPISIFDATQKLGFTVRFFEGSGFEGMYANEQKMILVASNRPKGRQTFTCAHELGHAVFRHGTIIDELQLCDSYFDKSPEEKIADIFAGHILMPLPAIKKAIKERNFQLQNLSPINTYILADYFGVGYTTIINHLYYGLQLISKIQLKNLIKVQPKKIKMELCGINSNSYLGVIDAERGAIPLDLQIGDFFITPTNIKFDHNIIELYSKILDKYCYKTIKSGITHITDINEKINTYIRISRKDYSGLSRYRYLEEVEDD